MKKNHWLLLILGCTALLITLMFAAVFGGGIAYFFLEADPVQAAFKAPVELNQDEGLLISSVKPESAAAEAGLVRGDIILEINGESVNNVLEMKSVFAELEPGDQVELTVLHGDDTRILLTELDSVKGFATLGVGICNISKGGKAFPGGPMGGVFIESFNFGAEIVEIVLDSPAESVGLQVGDVIISVDQKPISPKVDLADLIQKHKPGDVVILEVLSGMDEEPREVEVSLGENLDNPGKGYLGVAYQMGTPMGFENGDFPSLEMLPFGEMPEGFEGGDDMPHFFYHHGEEFDGILPEGWEEGGDFFHGMPFSDGEGMPHFFDPSELPESIEGAVIISEVMEETPAEEAGLQSRDLIIAVEGEPITEIENFIEEMQSRKPGDEVKLTILREDEEIEVSVTLTEHPDDPDKGFLGVLVGSFINIKDMDILEGFDQEFKFELPGVPGGDA